MTLAWQYSFHSSAQLWIKHLKKYLYIKYYLLTTRSGVVRIPFKQSRLMRIGRVDDVLREFDRKLQETKQNCICAVI
jgi:hypothetical protein